MRSLHLPDAWVSVLVVYLGQVRSLALISSMKAWLSPVNSLAKACSPSVPDNEPCELSTFLLGWRAKERPLENKVPVLLKVPPTQRPARSKTSHAEKLILWTGFAHSASGGFFKTIHSNPGCDVPFQVSSRKTVLVFTFLGAAGEPTLRWAHREAFGPWCVVCIL